MGGLSPSRRSRSAATLGRSALTRGESVAVSSIALFELWSGVAKSARTAANTERLAVFLAPLGTLPFDDDDARAAGAVRAALERAGGADRGLDTLLAGQAVRRGLVLVTANVAEFARVGGLTWQNWAE
jgi:tRNA(fMet)-specific endonuclease VapC